MDSESLDLRSLKAGQWRSSRDSSKYFTLSFISSVYEQKYDERDAEREKIAEPNVDAGLEAVRLIVGDLREPSHAHSLIGIGFNSLLFFFSSQILS